MADDLTTVLKFVGDSGNAIASIDAILAKLQQAGTAAAGLFSRAGSNEAATAFDKAAQSADRAAASVKRVTDNSLALAQATARLQVSQGNAAGAVETLKTALDGVDKNSVRAVNAQRQLVAIEAQVATAAGKAETAMLREAQAIARLQQIAGNTPAAIKTLTDALAQATNKSSLPALRAELQKTYLDTNYANSPLIGAINRVNEGFTRFLPLLGPVGTGMQRVIGFASAVGNAFKDTEKQSTGAIQSISQGVTGLAQTAASVAQSTVSVGQTVAAGLSQASEAVKAVTDTAKDVGKNLFTGSTEGAAAFLARARAANEAIVANSKAEARAAELSKQLGQAENARQSQIAQTILANQRIREKAVGEIAREEKAVRSLITAERERQAQAGKAETDLLRQGQAAQQAAGAFGIFARAKQLALAFFRDQGGEASATDFFLNLSKLASQAGDRMRTAISGAVTSIRQSLAGLGERSPFTTLFSGADKAAADVSTITKALPALTAESSAAAQGLTAVGGASTGMAVAIGAAVVAVAALVATIAGIVTVSAAAVSGLQAIGEAGVTVNAQLETLRVGLTTVIASVAEVRNSEGIQLKGIDAINAALPVASDQLRKLRIDALETSATIADIAPAFQAAIGPGLVAGLTIDQIRENTIKLTQAVTALGLPLDQIKQETRAILSGDINRNTQAAIALGISREAVKEAQKQGKFAEFLEQKLSAAAAAGKLVAQTFAAAQSNLKEAADTFQAIVTEGLFTQLRDEANKVLPQIFDKSKANLISDNFQGIADSLKAVFDLAGRRIVEVIEFAVEKSKELSKFLEENQGLILQAIESVDILGQSFVNLGVSIFDAFSPEKKTLVTTLKNGIDSASLSVAQLQDEAELLGAAFIYTIQAIVLGIEGPLASALDLFGIKIQGLTDDVARLETSMAAAQKRFSEGLKNTEEIERRIEASQKKLDVSQAFDKLSKEDKELAKLFFGGEGLNTPAPSEPTGKASGNTFKPPKRPAESGGSAASNAAKAARAEAAEDLKQLKIVEKEIELNAKAVSEALKNSLTDRLISLEDYTARSIQLERQVLRARLLTINEEEKAAVRASKTAAEVETKRADFSLKRATLIQDAERSRIEGNLTIQRMAQKAEEDHQKRLVQIREASRKAIEVTIRASAKSQLIGIAETAQREIEIERERFAERERLLNTELADIRTTKEERARLNDELIQLAIERSAFEVEASGKIRDAQKKEAEDFTALIRARVAAITQLRRAELETAASQAALAVQRGTLSGKDAALQELERRREAIRLESVERQAAIEREGQDLAKQAQQQGATAAAIVEIERNKNAQLTAERQRASAEIQILVEQGQALEATLSGNFAGLFSQRIGELAINLGLFKAVLTDFSTSVEATITPLNDILLSAFNGLAEGIGSVVQNYVLLGKTGPAVIRKLLAAQLAAIAQEAAVNAIKQLALGFAALFVNPPAAAGHFTSAALWATLAGGAALAGRAISPKEGGGSSGSGSAEGGGSDSRTIEQGGKLPAQQPIVIQFRARVEKGVMIEAFTEDYKNNGRTRDIVRRDTVRD